MSKTLYRVNELASTKGKRGVLPLSAATIWRLVKLGEFPKPFTIALNTTVWDSDDVDKWIESRKKIEYTPHCNATAISNKD